MPYIPLKQRRALDIGIASLAPDDAGELNYVITRLVDRWIGDDLNYGMINAAIGVLECAKLELYRKLAAPYEDMKHALNGGVVHNDIHERLEKGYREPTEWR